MDALFYILPSAIMAAAIFGAIRVVRRALQLRGAWNSGLTAEARCLRTFTTTHGGHGDTSVRTTLHHVYEFTTRDGRLVRFDEEDGPATVIEGDIVAVHYTQDPEVVATAQRPNAVKNVAGTAAILAFLGVVVAFCVVFMATFHQMSDDSTDAPFTSTESGGFDDMP